MVRTQQHREIRITSPLGNDVLLFHQMEGTEAISSPFHYDVEVLSEDYSIDMDKLLGHDVTVTMQIGKSSPRYFHGIVCSIRQDGCVGDLTRYRIVVRPWLWLLTQTADCKVFQKKSVPEIVEEVCKSHGFTNLKKSLSASYTAREYTVQYCETDFDFVSRLLESEGIYYYFEHVDGKHTLVLADSMGAHKALSGYESIPYFPFGNTPRERDHIYDWNISREMKPGKVVLTDYDFEKPKADLAAVSAKQRDHAQAKFEFFEFPGGYLDTQAGESYARKRMDEFQSRAELAWGAGSAQGITPGMLFKLTDFPRTDQNVEYLVTEARYTLTSDDYQAGGGSAGQPFLCTFTVQPSKQTYRPLRKTPTPRIHGIQTAVVVGKKSEDIWTDEYGRIKVQFHWDRYGKSDENSSCWVRVAQSWAGKGWGELHIPRIGQEVIVEFLHGDPSNPVVTGAVYNGDHKPPFKLPAEATKSGFRTQSTKDGNAKTFNELRFEDKLNEEQIYIHAERDFSRIVENNDTLEVGFEKKDAGDQTISIYNNQTVTLEKGTRKVEIKELDDVLTVSKGAQTIDISQGNQTIKLGKGDYSLKMDAGKGVIEAATSIELKVGGSSIKIEPSKITIKSVQIAIEAEGQLQSKAAMIKEQASGNVEIKGAMVKIN